MVCIDGGSKTFTQMEPFNFLLLEVHFNLDSMSNILAIKYVASIPGVHISMDSSKECVIIVEYKNHIIKFQEYYYGLYYYDSANTFISHVNYYYF